MSSFQSPVIGHFISVLNFILTVVFISLVLRSKRPPGSTMAWLLFILIVPYLGIPLYILLSGRKFKTALEKKRLNYEPVKITGSDTGKTDAEKILLCLGAPPPHGNVKAQLITDAQVAYQEIIGLIESAKKTVHLTTFIFAKDNVGEAILQALEKKVQEGVTVRILVDSLGAIWVKHPSFKNFIRAGGKMAHFMPFFHLPFKGRSNLRNHRKMLIVDSQMAIIGGMNIANEYMGPTRDENRWIDLALSIQGPSSLDMEDIFIQDWKFACGENIVINDSKLTQSGGKNIIQIAASGPDVEGDILYDFLLTLMYSAKKRIWIATPYFIPDESLLKALILAAKRGIDVRIWTPKKSNHSLADLARRSSLRALYDTDANIMLVNRMLHGKAVLVDHSYGLMGSANFDMRSLLLNYEVGSIGLGEDTIAPLGKWFLDLPAEKLIDLPKANYLTEMAEGVGRVLGPLI